MNPSETHHCLTISTQPLTFFFQEGSTPLGKKVLILGESLAKNGWVESGKAFYTTEGKLVPTGKRLNEELPIIGLTLEECAFTEIAKCYIGKNRKQLSVCGSLCAEHFMDQLDHFNPRIIISLGVITKEILEEVLKIKLAIGEISTIKSKGKSFSILPIYHPSPANPFGHAKNMAIIEAKKSELLKVLTK